MITVISCANIHCLGVDMKGRETTTATPDQDFETLEISFDTCFVNYTLRFCLKTFVLSFRKTSGTMMKITTTTVTINSVNHQTKI